ncbi:O-antigen polymerase [Flavobacterium sp. UMI-01]|uniref:O-antigen polymerase n=1 Tax=Flavobacterium sp. UMI-01 TaxID=1441053 RepID=UPI001C7CFE2D|nr:O-antigen polymerase [Flavobacterium sp. UMI-01]GIZ07429.1 hypothetical protein FUMI01_01560 [Flavobacterium sp. UMI-01]
MEETVLKYGGYYLLFSVILFFLFRKFLLSVFDPFLFVVLMMSSSLCLSVDSSIFHYVAISIFSFYLGFKCIGVPKRSKLKIDYFVDLRLLEIFTLLFFSLFFFVSIFIFKTAGIPLLSENPSEAKTSSFVEGTGWIRRIIFLSGFLPVCLSILLIASKKKLFYGFIFFLYALVAILQGSKSGLILSISIFWYFYQQNNIWKDSSLRLKRIIRSKIKYFLLITAFVFISIVLKESVIENQDPIFSVAFRLMEFGDVMLYYKMPDVRLFFSNLNFFDFFLYEFNGILGMLRIMDYYEPLGYQMVKAFWNTSSLFDDVVLGPNTVFFVRGHIFFGYIGGVFYSYLMGLSAAYLRKIIIEWEVKNVFVYALLVYVFFQIPTFLKESSQGVSSLFDFLFYLGPIFLISLFINESLKVFTNSRKINLYE